MTSNSIFKLDDLLVDSLLMGRIITKKEISFVNKEIEKKTLEKGLKLFEKIPQMSQMSSMTDCSKKEPEELILEIPTIQEGAPGHSSLLKSNGKEVAYMESFDVVGDTVIPTESNVMTSSTFETPAISKSSSEKAIEAILAYEEKGYTVDRFVKEFIENESDITELDNIQKGIVELNKNVSSPTLFTKNYLKEKETVDQLKKQQNQLTKDIRTYERNLEEHISKQHDPQLIQEEDQKMGDAIKALNGIEKELVEAERKLSETEYKKKNQITSENTKIQLTEIQSKIDERKKEIEEITTQQKDTESAKRIVQLITKDLKDSPEDLRSFLENNRDMIKGLTFSSSDAISINNIIRSIPGNQPDFSDIIEKLQKNISID
jgi:hypothetical protein